MGTVFLTNLAVVAGKYMYKQYDILSAILDFKTHNRLPLKKLWLIKNLKENPAYMAISRELTRVSDDFICATWKQHVGIFYSQP